MNKRTIIIVVLALISISLIAVWLLRRSNAQEPNAALLSAAIPAIDQSNLYTENAIVQDYMDLPVDTGLQTYCNPQVTPCVALCFPVGMYSLTEQGPVLVKGDVYNYFYESQNAGLARLYPGQTKPAIELWMEEHCGYSFPNIDPAQIRQGIHNQTCSTGGQGTITIEYGECQ